MLIVGKETYTMEERKVTDIFPVTISYAGHLKWKEDGVDFFSFSPLSVEKGIVVLTLCMTELGYVVSCVHAYSWTTSKSYDAIRDKLSQKDLKGILEPGLMSPKIVVDVFNGDIIGVAVSPSFVRNVSTNFFSDRCPIMDKQSKYFLVMENKTGNIGISSDKNVLEILKFQNWVKDNCFERVGVTNFSASFLADLYQETFDITLPFSTLSTKTEEYIRGRLSGISEKRIVERVQESLGLEKI